MPVDNVHHHLVVLYLFSSLIFLHNMLYYILEQLPVEWVGFAFSSYLHADMFISMVFKAYFIFALILLFFLSLFPPFFLFFLLFLFSKSRELIHLNQMIFDWCLYSCRQKLLPSILSLHSLGAIWLILIHCRLSLQMDSGKGSF